MAAKKSSPHTIRIPPLSPKERGVFDYIKAFIGENGFSPTFAEIQRHFSLASVNSVQNYIKQLSAKGYVDFPGGNLKRALQITAKGMKVVPVGGTARSVKVRSSSKLYTPSPIDSLRLPFLGKVAAGQPLESYQDNEFVDVPKHLLPGHVPAGGLHFVLQASGNSMIDEGILDRDWLIVRSCKEANNSELVVASISSDEDQFESTVKRFYKDPVKPEMIELRPSNTSLSSLWHPSAHVHVRGVVVALMRRY